MGEWSINYEYVGHTAYTLGILSFVLKDMLWLRSITIFSAVLCIVFNYAAPQQPMWVPIYWNSALVGINLIQIAIIFYEKRDIPFDEKEKWLYTTVFPHFTPTDFKRLMQAATWKSSGKDETLISEGEDASDLILITNGKCQVRLPEGPVAELLNGDFIGEMSFLSGKAASATVSAVDKVDYIAWDKKKLQQLLGKSASIQSGIKSAVSKQLTEKIVKTTRSSARL